jgi:hypothetical protein
MRLYVLVLLLGLAAPWAAPDDELKPETVDAYERYTTRLEQDFAQRAGEGFLLSPAALTRVRNGEVLAWPANEDGILEAPGGLIHHWRGAAFVPGATVARVLETVQDYGSYESIYDYVVGSSLLDHDGQGEPGLERFWAFLRIRTRARGVTGTFDLWMSIEYRYPEQGVATAASNADCVRQVEDAGTPGERRLRIGTGSGYLWRANTFATYRERDGGVYVDLQTVGLSRGFPPLLGWLIEPVVRGLGRRSVAQTLESLQKAVARGELSPGKAGPATLSDTAWCGETGRLPAGNFVR